MQCPLSHNFRRKQQWHCSVRSFLPNANCRVTTRSKHSPVLSSFQASKCNTTRVKQTPHKNDSYTQTQTLIRQSSNSQRCTQNHFASHHTDRHNPMPKHTFTARKDRTIRGSSEMKLRCISCLNPSVPAHQAVWQLWRWHHASFAQYKHNHIGGCVDRVHQVLSWSLPYQILNQTGVNVKEMQIKQTVRLSDTPLFACQPRSWNHKISAKQQSNCKTKYAL